MAWRPPGISADCDTRETSGTDRLPLPTSLFEDQAAPTPAHVFPIKTLDVPPSQSELDAKAAKDINEKNADAEFEKLKSEIEGGG